LKRRLWLLVLVFLIACLLLPGCTSSDPLNEALYARTLYTWDSGTSTWVKVGAGGSGSGDMTKAIYDPDNDGKVTPESHGTSHSVGAVDTIFPADPGVDRFLMWDDSMGVLSWEVAAGATDHGALTGLDHDDHLQYLLADGSRAVAGNLSISSGYGINFVNVLVADHTYSGLTTTLTAGEALVSGDIVYTDISSKMSKADADGIATMPVMAFATTALNNNTTGTFLTYGYVRDDTWTWTINGMVYADTVSGSLTQTAPTGTGDQVQVVGIALSSHVLFFNPQLLLIERG